MTTDHAINMLLSAVITLVVGLAIITALVLRQASKKFHKNDKEPQRTAEAVNGEADSAPDEPSKECRAGTK